MSTQETAARAAAVFIDLENNFGIPTVNSAQRFENRVDQFVRQLSLALGQDGVDSFEWWAVAQTCRKRERRDGTTYFEPFMSEPQGRILINAFKKHNGKVVLSRHKKADDVLIEELSLRLRRKHLPHFVVVVSEDTGYRKVLGEASRAGCRTIGVVRGRTLQSPFWLASTDRLLAYEDILELPENICAT